MKLYSTRFNSLCLWGTWFTLFWRWWSGCRCSVSDDCYHQPSDYPKQSPSIIPLMLLWSFIAFSCLPPVCIATCHTAYSSAGWLPGGILFAFQRRWARVTSPETPKWCPQIWWLSNQSTHTGEMIPKQVKTTPDRHLIIFPTPPWPLGWAGWDEVAGPWGRVVRILERRSSGPSWHMAKYLS